MKNKVMTAQEAVKNIGDGATIMVGGFYGLRNAGASYRRAGREECQKPDHNFATDARLPGKGVGKLLSNGQIKKLIATHVGLNPEVAQRMNTDVEEDKLECQLIPQGTFAERIRSGGAGLGGFLTPTGVGTIVAEGKQVINLHGRDYLLEERLRAEFALVRASVCDEFGNTLYNGTTQNFNPLMAMAADYVIVGTYEIVHTGTLDPNQVKTSGIFVDAVVGGEKTW